LILQIERRKNLQDAIITVIALATGGLVLLDLIGCSGMGLGGAMDDSYSDGDVDSDSDGDSDSDYVPGDKSGVVDEPEPTDDCDTENPVVLYMSADDSNSMAGPALARFRIENGSSVSGEIRTYEFLNYYGFDYAPAAQGTVSVSANLLPSEAADEYDLQIGVRAHDQAGEDRRPLNLTLSIDISGSMDGTPIQRVKQCCVALAGSLREGDVISMVTWDTAQSTLLESHTATGPNDATLVSHCNAISTGGGATDLHAGLVTAYDLALANFSESRINRVILVSDGGANVGVTDAQLIAAHADDAEGEAIYLMGVGIGDPTNPGYYNDDLMDAVTDAGKGSYIFIDSAGEAARMFGERFISNVEVAARDVRLELSLPPTFEMTSFHGEEYSTDADDVEPQHLAPGDAMIYHQTIGSCDPAAVAPGALVTITAGYAHPFTLAPQSATFESSWGDLLEAGAGPLAKGNAVVAYAEALKALQGAYGEGAISIIDETIATVTAAADALEQDPDLVEIAALLELYKSRF
jgi:Ca-activated chloride channel family protein